LKGTTHFVPTLLVENRTPKGAHSMVYYERNRYFKILRRVNNAFHSNGHHGRICKEKPEAQENSQ